MLASSLTGRVSKKEPCRRDAGGPKRHRPLLPPLSYPPLFLDTICSYCASHRRERCVVRAAVVNKSHQKPAKRLVSSLIAMTRSYALLPLQLIPLSLARLTRRPLPNNGGGGVECASIVCDPNVGNLIDIIPNVELALMRMPASAAVHVHYSVYTYMSSRISMARPL